MGDMGVTFWLIVIAITAVIYLIQYVIRKAINAGVDAASNAYKRKKNQDDPDQEQNLSDRYK